MSARDVSLDGKMIRCPKYLFILVDKAVQRTQLPAKKV